MKVKSYLFITISLVLLVVSFLGYIYFTKTPQFAIFFTWSQSHLYVFVPLLLFLKILGIVYPPLPSAIFTLGAIPIIGWLPAYLIDFSGSAIAGSIDYYLGKKYGLSFLSKIFDEETIANIKKIKIKPGREIESVFVLRVLIGGVVLEAVYYGAGLLKIPFTKFLIGALLSHVILGLPTFLLSEAIFQGRNILVSVVMGAIAIFLVYKLKGRYFE